MSFRRPSLVPESILRQQDAERLRLAPYATRTSDSRGRRYLEPEHPYRPCYVRDRDRIIHSSAFRRLAYKTQVFAAQPNDHHRTRLTHTLEVVQIARTVARNLGLNEDLVEAIALAHDLGHPPFGHAGERALATLLREEGGFEHNRQGLRLVERLESRYPSFPGLNLTYEVLRSMALHSCRPGDASVTEFESDLRMSAEGQLVDLCDSIAYSTHDIDDAIRHGLIGFDDLGAVELWRRAEVRARGVYGDGLAGKQLARAVVRSLIDEQVGGMIEESQRRLASMKSASDVATAREWVIALPEIILDLKKSLQAFLFERVYRHEAVISVTSRGEKRLIRLFEAIDADPSLLPTKYRHDEETPWRRRVVDYIASMTDRFAIRLAESLGLEDGEPARSAHGLSD